MALPVWLSNLIAYSLQIAILASVGTLLVYLFRIRAPRVTHIYWQVLLIACLFIPLLQDWEHPVSSNPQLSAPPMVQSAIPAAPASTNPKPDFRIPPETIILVLAGGASLRLIWLFFGLLRLRLIRQHARYFAEEPSSFQKVQQRTGI